MINISRLEQVRPFADRVLNAITDFEQRRKGFIHLYGVSSFASLLALRRGAEAEAELCAVAGMLHDLWSFETGKDENHAHEGANEARRILGEFAAFSDREVEQICTAIYNHSDKQTVGGQCEEILKDADVLQHFFYDAGEPKKENEKERLNKLFAELGISENKN